MKRVFGRLIAELAVVGGLLAVVAIPSISVDSAATVAAAATPPQHIGMKILVITDGSNANAGIAYADWVNTLQREGVPYTSVVTSSSSPGKVALPALASTLGNGVQVANYQGVVVSVSGSVGLTDAQWGQLQTFEHRFSVRQVTAYAVPSADYGLSAPNPTGGGPLSPANPVTLTASGSKVFPYLRQVSIDPTQSTWAYQGTTLAGVKVDTLISGPNGSSLLGVYTSGDGRQTMYQTFNQNQYMLQSGLLRHGELAWLTRNTYFGDQRNYLETHIDDNFLSDDAWSVLGNATTAPHSTDYSPANALREVPADVAKVAQWSAQNHFRIDMLFNGGGSVAVADGGSLVGAGDSGSGGTGSTGGTGSGGTGTDPLLAAFQSTDSATGKPYTNDFSWINHTWDHPNVDEGCSTRNYIEAEVNQNTNWGAKARSNTAGDPINGGLGLSVSTDPAATLGNENANAVVFGEHSGLANLLPGNPGRVDPPALSTATAATTGGTLATGQYVYAVSDWFNTAAPGAPASAFVSGESAASASAAVPVTGPTGSVNVTWDAVCHAGGYRVYRAPYTPPASAGGAGTIGAWSLIATVAADSTNDFKDPASTTDTTGGGTVEKTFTDTGSAGSAGTPQTDGTAVESAYEQNPALDAAFAGTLEGGIKYFGSDASKPYPNPADTAFATGSPPASQSPAGATFPDAGGTAVPRYPTNIYYNVSTNAQEVDEYTTLYDLPTCKDIPGVTTCYPGNTAWTIGQIVASIDQGMFQHVMSNDPRPHYFHQTNLMSQTTGGVNYQGDGLFYETLDPLLKQYHQYFADNAPIVQLTMAQIGTLLKEQAGWAAANTNQVSGYISGNVVTVTNNGSAIEIPLTGTTVGTPYGGSQSGWVLAASGISTYRALAAWPQAPTGPAIVMPPTGRAPGGPPAGRKKVAYIAVQTTPKTVRIKHKKVTVSLMCKATKGKSARGKTCSGKFTLTVSGRKVRHSFRFKSGRIDRIPVILPSAVRKTMTARGRKHKHPKLKGKLAIVTVLPWHVSHTAHGTLTIKS